jgi:hypothetical protein
VAIWWSLCAPKGSDNPGKPRPEVRQDLADVVAAGAEDGKEGITNRAFQRASRQAAILSFWAGVMPPMPMFGRSLL